MIELYFAESGNSLRAVMMLEECGLPYTAHKLDLSKGEQRAPEFLKLNPFGKVPVIMDPHGPDGHPVVLTQSAAIMLYLAQKASKFLPQSKLAELKMMEWLMVAAGDVGPANAQILYMNRDVPDLSDKGRAFLDRRLVDYLRVAEAQLAESKAGYLAGELSLADFALFHPCAYGASCWKRWVVSNTCSTGRIA
jgi:GST-like protein